MLVIIMRLFLARFGINELVTFPFTLEMSQGLERSQVSLVLTENITLTALKN